ncbi:hypothetical protein [Planktothricoides raciborskii]|uniref:Uncharacterized protein n=1 Tax=Planktothricoides raciborskii FACHB-1370 TaxID=2949576 RepID=A0ABR8EL31_9CYAN|nr:hypothetical protein [Planktothricoides raciborskii]MBD2547473.1 hypothetical protein [Planktothricoides raciborskii FACHB-1370]MBD2583793.1 hypothetical protein [Planktothricoides raciborskii FACHB-1261]
MMSPEPDSKQTNIDEVFARIQDLLLETWEETGFGCLSIESDRPKNEKIRIVIKGGTHYRYVITDEEVRTWIRNKS